MKKYVFLFISFIFVYKIVYSKKIYVAFRTEYLQIEDRHRGSLKSCHKNSDQECPYFEQLKYSPFFKYETSPYFIGESNFAFDLGLTSPEYYSAKLFDFPKKNETTLIEFKKEYGFQVGFAYYFKFSNDENFIRLGLVQENSPVEFYVNNKKLKGKDEFYEDVTSGNILFTGMGYKLDYVTNYFYINYRRHDKVDYRTEQQYDDGEEPNLKISENFIIIGLNIYPFIETYFVDSDDFEFPILF